MLYGNRLEVFVISGVCREVSSSQSRCENMRITAISGLAEYDEFQMTYNVIRLIDEVH